MKKILFTGGGGSASQSIYEQWGGRYIIYFADANVDSIPGSIPDSRKISIPFAREKNFTSEIKRLCAELNIDLLVPGVDEELAPLAKMHGIPGWPKILVPSLDFVNNMLDKKTCAETMHKAGLLAPVTVSLLNAEQIGFPLIAKPRSGRGSRGVMILENIEQVRGYLSLYGGDPDDYIAQQLITGEEYTVLVAASSDGELRAVIPVLAHEKRGVTIRAETAIPPAIIEYAQNFHNHFKTSGVYNIQCMLTGDNKVYPFEVNPRISTTFVLGIATGFDPVPMVFDEAPSHNLFIPDGKWTLRRSWLSTISKI